MMPTGGHSAFLPKRHHDARCFASDCANDPFCCNSEWDILCVNAAVAPCGICDESDCMIAHLDGNGYVDTTDLGMVLADFGCVGADCVGDMNGDGVVVTSDLAIMLGMFRCEG